MFRETKRWKREFQRDSQTWSRIKGRSCAARLRINSRSDQEPEPKTRDGCDKDSEDSVLTKNLRTANERNWITRPIKCLTEKKKKCQQSILPQTGMAVSEGNLVKMNLQFYVRLAVRKHGNDYQGAAAMLSDIAQHDHFPQELKRLSLIHI